MGTHRRPAGSRIACALIVAAVIATPATAQPTVGADVRIAREAYRGWPNTYRLSNGLIDAAVVTDVGPRIIELQRAGGPNLFHVRDAEAGGHDESQWTLRGGWRLWVAPERRETTYALDNAPCRADVDGATLRVTGPPQPDAGIQKVIEVTLDPQAPRLHLVSHIRNIADHPLTYAAWSLSVMQPGGRAFAPLDVGALDAFDATRGLRLWSYAKLSDPRYRFGDRLVQIDQSVVARVPVGAAGRRSDESKVGVDSAQGWGAYLLDGTLYIKRFPHDAAGRYPDGGSTVEIYSSGEFLELEQLSPLTTIAPGQELVFPEDWWLFAEAVVPAEEQAALTALAPYLERTAMP